ncbi:MAG: hypothetical protein KGL39_53845 [Patescibacteria group bacterium]|nr:hypothetical protein [Patescibacteria group bacterium]
MKIKVIEKPGVKVEKPLTIEEMVAGIGESLKRVDGKISAQRLHSVESHLRTAIRLLGFKATAANPGDLHAQLKQCVDNTQEITQENHDLLRLHLAATHSNCAAENGTPSAPALKDIPAPAPEKPADAPKAAPVPKK